MRKLLTMVTGLVMLGSFVPSATALTISDPREDSSQFNVRYAKLVRPTRTTYSWTMITYGDFGTGGLSPLAPDLLIDIKGTTAPDYRIKFYAVFDFSCQVQRPGVTYVRSATATHPTSRSVVCSFSTQGLGQTKPIRWKASWPMIGYTDRVPDAGYAVGV